MDRSPNGRGSAWVGCPVRAADNDPMTQPVTLLWTACLLAVSLASCTSVPQEPVDPPSVQLPTYEMPSLSPEDEPSGEPWEEELGGSNDD